MKPSKKAQIKQRLEDLMLANGGRLTPQIVINDAKSPTSVLHGHFTWDIKKAAHKCWIDQARELIRSVRIEVRTETHFVNAPRYVRDPKAGRAQGYAEVASLKTSKTIAREALQAELDRVIGALERAQEIAISLGLHGEVAKFLNGLRLLKELSSEKVA